MDFKKTIESNYKIYLSFIAAAGMVFIFQNCSKIDISGGNSDNNNSAVLSTDKAATDIIAVMLSAGIKDQIEFDETIDLTADSMTCGTKFQSTAVVCVFVKGKIKLETVGANAQVVQDYLSNIGIIKDCASCIDVRSYTVKNLKCIQVPNFPNQSTCKFDR